MSNLSLLGRTLIALLLFLHRAISVEGQIKPCGIVAGPMYQVMLQFPLWSLSGYVKISTDTNSQSQLSFSAIHSLDNHDQHLFYVHFYYDTISGGLFVAIQSSVDHRWITHHGAYTQPHNPAQLESDYSEITCTNDRRLFECVLPEHCTHDGIVVTVPGESNLFTPPSPPMNEKPTNVSSYNGKYLTHVKGTNLYLNGVGNDGDSKDGLIFGDYINYFIMYPSRLSQPTVHRRRAEGVTLGERLAIGNKILRVT